MTPYELNKPEVVSGKTALAHAVHLIESFKDKPNYREDRQRLAEIIRELIFARAHPNTPDVNGQRLQLSVRTPLSVSRELIAAKLDPRTQSLCDVQTQETMQLLLGARADPNVSDPGIDRQLVRTADTKPIGFLRRMWRYWLLAELRYLEFLGQPARDTIASYLVLSAEEASADIAVSVQYANVSYCCYCV